MNKDQLEGTYPQGNLQAQFPGAPVQNQQSGPPADVYFGAGNSQPLDKFVSPPPAYSANTCPQDISTKGFAGNAQDVNTPAGYPIGHPESGYPNVQPGQFGDENIVNTGLTVGLCEDPDIRFDFTVQSIRKAFIRKVYAILMCQLVVTLSFIAIFVFHEPTKLFVQEHREVTYCAFGVTIVCLITLVCFEEMRRKFPTNLIFLGIFTVAESIMLGVVSSLVDSDVVLLAIGLTAAICFALTLFAFQTKYDFTACGGILLCSLVLLLIFGIVSAIYGTIITRLVYSCLGALLAALFLIYDTQLIIGGEHKYTFSPEEYVFAALTLYIDIIRMFIYILRILRYTR